MHGINEALRIDGNREKWRRKAIDSPEWDSLLALTADWPESTRSALCDIVADVFFGRLPEVSPKVRYDAQQLAFREQLSARIAWIRECGRGTSIWRHNTSLSRFSLISHSD